MTDNHTGKMLPRRKWHPSITEARVIARHEDRMTSLDDPSICLACGADADGVEPDARNYDCESCGEHQVFGIEEIVIAIV